MFSLEVDLQVRLKVNRCADVHVVAFADWFPTQMMIDGADLCVDFHADWNPDLDTCMCVRRSWKQAVRKRKGGGQTCWNINFCILQVNTAKQWWDVSVGYSCDYGKSFHQR